MTERLTYSEAGVKYDVMDPFKLACQAAAAPTREYLRPHGWAEVEGIRGESAYLMETPEGYVAHVEEALGTKSAIADAVYALTGRSFYRNVAIDDISTIVNDLVTTGALPVSVAMYAAVGDAGYLADPTRARDLAAGFAEGCRLSGAVWAGGETQVLKGVVDPGAIVLGGSAVGYIACKDLRIRGDVRDGDAIVCVASSGIQTNGATLCRAVAERLPEGYLTQLPDGRPFGEALLDASVIYVPFVRACQQRGVRLHYAVHLTGHGWRKLMRLDEPFVYRVESVGTPQPVFRLLQEAAGLDVKEAYSTFNMGVGFVVYVSPEEADECVACATSAGLDAWVAGNVYKDGDRKAVELAPLKIAYDAESLRIR